MSQLTVTVPNLIAGISQQPDSLRFPSQAERQVNAYASVVDGLIKRHPTQHVAKLYDAGDEGTQFRVIPIRGSDGVDYFAHVTRSNLRVFDVDGNEYPVKTGTAGGAIDYRPDFTYLATRQRGNFLADIAETFELGNDLALNGSDPLTPSILSTSFPGPFQFKTAILVGNGPAATDGAEYRNDAAWSVGRKTWFSVFVKDIGSCDSFQLELQDQTGTLKTWTASFTISAGVVSDDGTTTAGAESGVVAVQNDGWYRVWIGVDPDDAANAGVIAEGDAMLYTLRVQDTATFPSKALHVWGLALQTGGTTLPNYFADQAEYRYVTIQDTTILANTTFPVEMGAAVTDSLEDTTTSGTDAGHAFLFVRQGSFKTTYSITIDTPSIPSTTITTETWDGTAAAGSEIATVKTDDIAADLASKLNALTNITATSFGSVVRVESTTVITEFETEDSQGDTALVGFNQRIDAFESLPLICADGYKVLVEASPETTFDDYYVEFIADNTGAFGNGHWVESTPYETPFEFDDTTMPHQLVRRVDTQFGLITGTPGQVYFDWDASPWEDRLVGSEDSNPNPSFVTTRDGNDEVIELRTITDVYFYKGRLGFLSGEYVILSEANRFFSFWRTSVRDLIDSDPIDISSSVPRSSRFHSAIPFNDRLIVFSELGQALLQSGAQALTPTTAGLTSVLEFENLAVQPFTTGRGIYFGYEKNNFSGIREMFPIGEGLYFDSEDTSAQIPRYITGEIVDIQGSALDDIVVARTDTDKDRLYVHKFYRQGNEKLQAAWFEYQFGADVEEMFFIDNTLFLIYRRTEGVFLEKMVIGDGVVDPDATFLIHLDRRISDETAGVTPTYDAVSDTTEFTLPYDIESGQTMQVVTRETATDNGGIILQIDSIDTAVSGSHTITVNGDQTTTPVWIGEVFTMTYEFSSAALRVPTRNGSVSTVEGRFQVRFGNVNYADSSYFKVLVTPDGGTTYTYEFSGSVVGSSSLVANQLALVTGTFRFPVASRNTEVTVVIESDAPTPCRLLNAEWLGTYNTRFSR